MWKKKTKSISIFKREETKNYVSYSRHRGYWHSFYERVVWLPSERSDVELIVLYKQDDAIKLGIFRPRKPIVKRFSVTFASFELQWSVRLHFSSLFLEIQGNAKLVLAAKNTAGFL